MISVIVAVYNAEDFIRKCLDSLINQTFKDFEVICIDDASTDSSVAIINEYMLKDTRIKLLRMEKNAGQAVARNYGIVHAKGDIITFLDADDWFDEQSLRAIADTFEQYPQTDCAVFRCIMAYEDGRQEEYKGEDFEVLSGRDASFLSLTWRIHGCYAARCELYEKYPYDTTSHLYSDDNTAHVHYFISREVRQSKASYYYFQHSRSATHRISIEKMHYMAAAESLCKQMNELGCDDEMLSLAQTQWWRIIVDCYFYYYKNRRLFTKEDKAYCLATIRSSYKEIDLTKVGRQLLHRLGYMPLAKKWILFRLEEEFYFFLRSLLGRN